MKKLNKKGFFLSESLIVGAVVTAVVTLLYLSIMGILNNYSKREYYNNVSTLYTADNIRSLMYDKGIGYFIEKLGSQRYYLVNCGDFQDSTSLGEEELCEYIFNFGTREQEIGDVVVDKVIFTNYDVTQIKGYSDEVAILEGTTTDYISTIPIVRDTNDYRIIVILKERPNNGNSNSSSKYWYTTLKIEGE